MEDNKENESALKNLNKDLKLLNKDAQVFLKKNEEKNDELNDQKNLENVKEKSKTIENKNLEDLKISIEEELKIQKKENQDEKKQDQDLSQKDKEKELVKITEQKPQKNENDLSDDDLEILKFIEDSKPKIYVFGAGGSGCNTLTRLFNLGISDITLIAGNTDARHLLDTKAHRKVLLGKKLTKGRGAGSDPKIGESATKESSQEIGSIFKNSDMVFVTCGLGGGTGTGCAPLIAQLAKEAGALTVAVVTLPFKSEGVNRMQNAIEGLKKLKQHADITIIIRNDKLLTIAPDLPLNTAFKVSDEVLASSVKGISELVTQSGMVNVDFADLKTAMLKAGYAVIGMGEASKDVKIEDRARIAVETALNSPLLEADLSSANRALINIIGGEDMTLKEAETIIEETVSRISQNSNVKWGARIDPSIKKSSIRVLVVLSGAKFPQYENVDDIFAEEEDEELPELDLDLLS